MLLSGGQIILNIFRMWRDLAGSYYRILIFVFLLIFCGFYLSHVKNPWNYPGMLLKSFGSWTCDFFDLERTVEFRGRKIDARVFYRNFANGYLIRQKQIAIQSLKLAGYSIFGLCLFSSLIMAAASLKLKKKYLRGNKEFSKKELSKKLTAKEKSSFKLGGLRFAKDMETEHILISGAPGSGKTTCILELMEQVRKKKQKAVVLDVKGTYTETFFDASKDFILNPIDERSPIWNIWDECQSVKDYKLLAGYLVPQSKNLDSFWTDSARIVLASALEQFASEKDLAAFLDFLYYSELSTISEQLANSIGSSFLEKGGEKMALGVLASIKAVSDALIYLKPGSSEFLFKDWIEKADDSFLFLNCNILDIEIVGRIMGFWITMLSNFLMSFKESKTNRTWFFLDELPRIHVQSLESLVSFGRSYGACVVAAFQDINQLKTAYRDTADSIIGSMGTKIIFKAANIDSANWASNLIGEEEVHEYNKNFSMGSHKMRDGQSYVSSTKNRKLFLPSEILNLEPLNALFCRDGVAKVEFRPKTRRKLAEGFLKRDLSGISNFRTEAGSSNRLDVSNLLD